MGKYVVKRLLLAVLTVFMTVIMSYSAMGAEGDIVTVPSYQLGLPDSNYLTVDEMITQGMGGARIKRISSAHCRIRWRRWTRKRKMI